MLKLLRKISLTQRILIGMGLGVLIGWLFPEISQDFKVLSNIFIRMIKSIIVPLLFSTLVIGIAGHSDDLKAVGRLAFKSILYFEIVTTIALIIGLVMVNTTQPGIGVSLPVDSITNAATNPKGINFTEMLEHVVPKSVVEAAANNDVLQIVFFSILFGMSLTLVKGRPKEVILGVCEGLAQVMFKFTGIVMKFAPIGIGAAMIVTVGHSGLDVLINLGKLVLTMYGALVILLCLVFLPIIYMMKIPLRRFVRAVKEPALIAFSTTSSDAALPVALENMEKFGVPRHIVSFVLPTGYSFNLDGSTLYLAVASIFVAQAAGVDLTIGQQITMMLTLMLTTKGIAAVPRASLVILSGTLAAFGLPLEGVAIILGVDELMDMARTSVNIIGNCLASAVMARWEGMLDTSAEVEFL